MSNTVKALLIGCGVLVILGIGGCFVVVSYLLDQPEGVEISVDAPGRAVVGEAFEIVARVRNVGDRDRELVDLDVADEYLEGIVVVDTEPDSSDSMHVPFDNTVSYSFGLTVPPAGEVAVTLSAEAVHAGDFAGDVDFCIDSEVHCLSAHVRTVVTAAP